MKVLVWHVHGSWTTSFVQGGHDYLIPTEADRGPWGVGRPAAWDWPAGAVETPPEQLAEADIDVVVLQRPEELELVEQWCGRRPGQDVAAVYLEHNTPRGPAAISRHPLADRDDIPIVHVTDFNQLMWDNGCAPTVVVPHGIVDPGERYTGELDRAAVVINEPVRRWRVTGTDLLPGFSTAAGIDVFGMGLAGLTERLAQTPDPPAEGAVRAIDDLPQRRLHDEMARRRLYLHPMRWTSLGLSLLEAMQLGMPVVALACTEAPVAVPPEAGVVSTSVIRLRRAVAELVADPDRATEMGRAARKAALADYGLPAFLRRWDDVLGQPR
ncbi:MAG TPA: glycosyltransferase [Pseudonocardia sp.]|uniref:glycosyltransferase n=1 Tax=Pseudonocardia sp. TaxID=60912 RepID=UPI002BAE3310|nr:glycosyltransferase [Pseudonocardia sp.]HTF54764.1 glycosyltransferase [Pseudonocardia sp.]